MSTFFHGWRRKTGCILLLMAGVFMAAWLRSLSVIDKFSFSQQQSCHFMLSMDGNVSWRRLTPFDENMPPGWSLPTRWVTTALTEKNRRNSVFYWDGDVHWRWHWGGFDFGAGLFEMISYAPAPTSNWLRREEIWQIPYWSIVMPLTLLSAHLIFRKQRKPLAKTPATDGA